MKLQRYQGGHTDNKMEKNSSLGTIQSKKSIWVMIMLSLFLVTFFVSSVSAAEWDNVKSYDKNTNTVTIKNSFGLPLIGNDLVSSTLNTPQVYQVLVGKDVKVAQFTINPYTDYPNLIGQIESYDLKKGGQKTQKDYKIRYFGTEEYIVNDYTCQEFLDKNGSKSSNCFVSGNHTEQREVWKDWDKNAYANKEVIVGLFTDVGYEETIEWIPTIAGVKVEEWAVFTSGATTTTDGAYTVVTYLNNGTFNTTSNLNNVAILVVGGGGGGGGYTSDNAGGGGGAGGVIYNSSATLLSGNYDIIVGVGGGSTIGGPGIRGQNSSFGNANFRMVGWGGGPGGQSSNNAGVGGSGGGGGSQTGAGGAATQNSVNGTGYGNAGGSTDGTNSVSSGGGGAGAAGSGNSGGNGGNGGNGRTFNITNGTDLYYAGGGGGSSSTGGSQGSGGLGGGGAGAAVWGGNATNGTGGGGGGGQGLPAPGGDNGRGGNGGSGIVIVRYLTSSASNLIGINLLSPENNTLFSTNIINLSANLTKQSSISIVNVSLLINGVINETNTSGATGFYNFSISGIAEGQYNWTVIAYGNDSIQYNASNGTLFFMVDTIKPQIAINYPPVLLNYSKINNSLQLNWTVTDVNIDKCWYNYNGTNITLGTCTTAVANLANITLTTKKFVEFYANDTAGNLNFTNYSWNYRAFQTSLSYNNPTLETSSETFSLNLTTLNSEIPTNGVFTYAGTSYNTTTTVSGGVYTLTRTIEIPTVVSTQNKTFNYTFTVNGTSITTENFNQTVNPLNFSYCGSPYTGLTYNFTTYDGASSARINASFEATYNFWAASSSGATQKEYTYQSINQNVSQWTFCLDSGGINVTLDGFINFYADGYDSRDYIISNVTIGNFSSALYQNISLYLGATADTDVVTITVQDQNYNRISGALVSVQEWNVGTNTYSTLGMFNTDAAGQGIINLELFNIWYRAIVVIDGEIVEVTDVTKLADTTWFITVDLGVDNPYSIFGDITCGVDFDNSTNITTFTWVDIGEDVNQGCLVIRNSTNLGYETINSECMADVAGIINYQLSGNGEYEIIGTIYLTEENDGVLQNCDVLHERLGTPSITETVSPFGKVISFIFIGTSVAVGIAASSPVWGSLLLIGSIFVSAKLGWFNITDAIFWGLLSIVIVILFRLSKK